MIRVASESENEAGLSWDVKYGRLPPSILTLKNINKRTCHKDDQIIINFLDTEIQNTSSIAVLPSGLKFDSIFILLFSLRCIFKIVLYSLAIPGLLAFYIDIL